MDWDHKLLVLDSLFQEFKLGMFWNPIVRNLLYVVLGGAGGLLLMNRLTMPPLSCRVNFHTHKVTYI